MLRDLSPDHTVREMATLLGRPVNSVWRKDADLGLHQIAHRGEAQPLTLREEIAAAKREWATAPLYRPGSRDD